MQDCTSQRLIEFEQEMVEAWKGGRIQVPLHLSGGNEDTLIEIFREVGANDWVVSTHRNHYHYLLKTGDEDGLRKEILGDVGGVCRGRSGSMHTTNLGSRVISSCLVGCGAPVAVGIALGIKLRNGSERVWCFVGDGAVDQGMFWEALTYAEGRDLPVTFVVEDNDRSVDSSCAERGVSDSRSREGVLRSDRVRWVKFKATWPHVGNGEHISF